jgi:hypothetical protein
VGGLECFTSGFACLTDGRDVLFGCSLYKGAFGDINISDFFLGSRSAEITMKFWEFLKMLVMKSLRKLTENLP